MKAGKKVKKRSRKKQTKRPKKGNALLNEVIQLTGLPPSLLKTELQAVLDKKNISIGQLGLCELRSAAASYLREIMTSLIEKNPIKNSDPVH